MGFGTLSHEVVALHESRPQRARYAVTGPSISQLAEVSYLR